MRTRPAAYNRQGARPSNTSFLELVQQTRQKHLKLWQDDINAFRNFAGTFRAPVTQPAAYDIEAVAVEDGAPASGNYQIDPASLITVQNAGLYTINGIVTGAAGSQARIRVWVGNASTNQKFFDTYGNEILVYGALPLVDLGSGSNTFSLVVDSSKLPANVPQPLSAANPWVITASGPGGEDESTATLVPLPTSTTSVATFGIDAGTVTATQSGSMLTITGTAREPNNTPAIARVWLGLSNGSKQTAPGTLTETLLGTSNAVSMAGGAGTFTVTIDLSKLPAGVAPPTSANPYVVTLCDTAGGNEMPMPVLVPPAGAAPAPFASFSIDAGSVKATQSGTMLTITGTAREPNNIPAVARVWLGLSNGSKAIVPGSFAETLVGTSNAVTLTGGTGVFTVVIDLSKLPPGVTAPTATNPYVVTLSDATGGYEMPMPAIVPLVGSVTPPATPVPAPTIADPAGPVSVTGNVYPIAGSVPASASRLLIQAWPASGTAKLPGAAPAGAIVLDPGATTFTLQATLTTSGANQFVVSATDLTTMQESALFLLPTITTSSTTLPAAPTTTPTAPAPAAATAMATTVPPPSLGTENIESVQGIGDVTAPLLRSAGIRTTGDLLNAGATRTGRAKLAKTLGKGFTPSSVLEWVNRVDLARVIGIGPEYSDLLEAAGVDTVRELARRKPADLYDTLSKVNAGHKPNPYVRQLPTKAQVASWVTAAKGLPTVVKF